MREPCIEIVQGRHPVVEARLAETGGGSFIAERHAGSAPKQRMQVITGPNMGGKSDLHAPGRADRAARRDGLVRAGRRPAGSGPIDAIHTRIGAADDLANAQSTFMLEMTEAAQILHARHAHSRWC